MTKYFLLLAALTATAEAASISLSSSPAVAIPDGSSAGVTDQIVVTGSPEVIFSVTVDVSLSPTGTGGTGFFGDLYLYLSNGTDRAVLLNRAGKTTTNPAGYDDSVSVSVTFSDFGTNDIHLYRVSETGDNGTPLSQPLSGTWQPDARDVDPATVVDTDARTANLSVFSGTPADGTYTLFAADLSSGDQFRIDSWTLNLETIPEPSTLLLSLFSLPALFIRKRTKS